MNPIPATAALLRGIDGVPADADRHEGFTEALKKYPDIKVVASVFTGWSPDKGAQETKNLISSGKQIDGIWTSGIDKAVVDAYKTANVKYVPVVGADNNGFMGQEIDLKDAPLVGINVTNPPAVGGAGLSIALDVLDGKKVPRVTHLTPKVYDNSTPEGMEWLKSLYDPKVDPNYPVYSPVHGLMGANGAGKSTLEHRSPGVTAYALWPKGASRKSSLIWSMSTPP
jgi:ribose transport system substrate-binding protein